MRAANAKFRRFDGPVDLRPTLGSAGGEILPQAVAPPFIEDREEVLKLCPHRKKLPRLKLGPLELWMAQAAPAARNSKAVYNGNLSVTANHTRRNRMSRSRSLSR